jgi:hypothetical protein
MSAMTQTIKHSITQIHLISQRFSTKSRWLKTAKSQDIGATSPGNSQKKSADIEILTPQPLMDCVANQ